jgi:hypothetical protein
MTMASFQAGNLGKDLESVNPDIAGRLVPVPPPKSMLAGLDTGCRLATSRCTTATGAARWWSQARRRPV